MQAPDGMLFEVKQAATISSEHDEQLSGLRHIALTVDDFEETVDRFKSFGVVVITEPTISATGGKTFFFRDPEGNIFQLIYRAERFF